MYRLSKRNKKLVGTITLPASKSISNRALIIQSMCGSPVRLDNIASSADTLTVNSILERDATEYWENIEYNVGAAGTAMRFLTAYFASIPGTRVLTGSSRMKQRPVKPLVDALIQLGADICYLEQDGYPPLKIAGKLLEGSEVGVDGTLSSQYITALMLISPRLVNGLVIHLKGKITSASYINLTLKMMKEFGVTGDWKDNTISVSNQSYKLDEKQVYKIEADWSSASYWYAMAALSDEVDLKLMGLKSESIQGDKIVKELFALLGVKTELIEGGVHLSKEIPVIKSFAYDFSDCPDLAQTIAVTAVGMRMPILMNGLQTLKIKETDRIAALITEFGKLGVSAIETFPNTLEIREYPLFTHSSPRFSTYDDHRMALSFAPLSLVYRQIEIENPEVVQKSYPGFWDDLSSLGFEVLSLPQA